MKTDYEKHIDSQLKRLSHLVGFPVAPEALRDYIAALTVAETCEGTTRVLDAFVQDPLMRDCPTAAMIRGKAWEDRERQKKTTTWEPRGAHCPECRDFGIAESTNDKDLNSIASYCDCAAGQEAKRRGHREGAYGCHDGGSACVGCINAARANLRKKFPGGDPLAKIRERSKRPRTPDTVYNGDF